MNITNPVMRKGVAGLTGIALALTLVWSGGPVWAAAPSAPVITSPTDGTSTSTTPVRIYGTAEAGTEVFVSGGATPASGTVDSSGNWTALVNLTPDSSNLLSFVSRNSGGEDSTTTTLTIIYSSSTTTPDTTAPSAPVITFPTSPYSTTTSPLTVTGTAEAGATVSVTGGSATASTTVSGGGDFSLPVFLTSSSTNMLLFLATDASGNVSSSTALTVISLGTGTSTTSTTTTSTSSPMINLLGDQNISAFVCNLQPNGFIDPGATAFTSGGGTTTVNVAGSVNASSTGTYTLTYTATDNGLTATTTRTVTILDCNSGGGGGGSSGSSGGSSSSGSSGSTNSNNTGTTEVLGAYYDPSINGYPMGTTYVLGETYVPGMPTTGAGGEAGKTFSSLLLLLGIVGGGLVLLKTEGTKSS